MVFVDQKLPFSADQPSARVWSALRELLEYSTSLDFGQKLLQAVGHWPGVAKATLVLLDAETARPVHVVYHLTPGVQPGLEMVTLKLEYQQSCRAWMALIPPEGQELPAETLADIQALVHMAGPVLAHLQALEAERAQRKLADVLCRLSTEIGTIHEEFALVTHILEHLARLVTYTYAAVLVLEEGTWRCLTPLETDPSAMAMLTPEQRALLDRLQRERQPLMMENVSSWRPAGETARAASWMGIPLTARGDLWGVIILESDRPRAFGPEQVQIAIVFAEQAALALDNSRLYREERQRREELEIIQRLNLLVASELEPEPLHKAIVQAVRGLVQPEQALLYVVTDAEWKTADAPVQAALLEARPWMTPEEEGAAGIRMVMPLNLGARVVGALDLRWAPGAYLPMYRTRLQALAPQIAVALDKAHLYQDAVDAARRRAVLHAVGQQIISAVRDLPSLYAAIHQATQQLMPCDAFLLGLVTESGDAIEVVYAVDRGKVYTGVRAPRGQGLSWHVVSTGQALLVREQEEEEIGVKAILVGEEPVRSLLFVPMRLEQRIFGVLSAQSYQPDAYTSDDITLLEMLAAQAAIAIENARLLQQTQRRAALLEAQNTIIVSAASAEDLSQLLAQILDLVMETLQTPLGGIWVGTQYEVRNLPDFAAYGEEAVQYAQRLDLTRPLAVVDWDTIELTGLRVLTGPFLRKLGFRSSLTIPIKNQGQTIGGLLIGDVQPRHWNAEEIALVETIGHQVGAVVRRLQLVAQIQAQAMELERYSRSLEDQVRARTQELERTYQTLSEQHARLDAIVRHITDALVVTDGEGQIVLVNPAFCAMMGMDAESLRGLSLTELLPASSLLEALKQVQTAPEARVTVTYAHGERVYRSTSVLLGETEPLTVVTVLHDITGDIEMARMKDDFVSMVSHELRTPMTSILGFSQLIGRQFHRHILPHLPQDDPEVQKATARITENLDIIAREGARLTRLINDVLDLARMEAGRLEWASKPFTIESVVSATLAALRSLILEKRIPVHTAIPPDLPAVVGDPDRIIQVLTNLLGNALKFTDQGMITVAAELLPPGTEVAPWGARQPGAETGLPAPYPAVLVSVTDSGPGIPAADMARLFQRFQQGGAQRGGSGLGLAICREIIQHHHGAIWVESRLGQGSRFLFTLPLP